MDSFIQMIIAFLASLGFTVTPPQAPTQPAEIPPISQEEPTQIPAPGLVFGVIGLGVAAWRRRNQTDTNEETNETNSGDSEV